MLALATQRRSQGPLGLMQIALGVELVLRPTREVNQLCVAHRPVVHIQPVHVVWIVGDDKPERLPFVLATAQLPDRNDFGTINDQ